LEGGAKARVEGGAKARVEGGAGSGVEGAMMEQRRRQLRIVHADVNECARTLTLSLTLTITITATSSSSTSPPLHHNCRTCTLSHSPPDSARPHREAPPTLPASPHGGTASLVLVLVVVVVDDVVAPSLDAWWDGEPFSAILLDPPCTASGLLRTLPEVKAHRDDDDVATLRKMQLALLKRVWPLLRPGGALMYTTCSILREENDVVVATFCKRTSDAVAVEVPLPASLHAGGSLTTCRRSNGAVLFLPSETHQGGYVAQLRKREL
jgi:hypothetical protein